MNLARPPARGHAQVRTARRPVVRVLLRRSLLTVAVLILGLLTLGPGLLGPGLLGPRLQPTSFEPSPAVATPLTTVNTRDLHSRAQQHQQGRRDKLFVNVMRLFSVLIKPSRSKSRLNVVKRSRARSESKR